MSMRIFCECGERVASGATRCITCWENWERLNGCYRPDWKSEDVDPQGQPTPEQLEYFTRYKDALRREAMEGKRSSQSQEVDDMW